MKGGNPSLSVVDVKLETTTSLAHVTVPGRETCGGHVLPEAGHTPSHRKDVTQNNA